MDSEDKGIVSKKAENNHRPFLCGDCPFLSETDSNDWHEYWCSRRVEYREPGGKSCFSEQQYFSNH